MFFFEKNILSVCVWCVWCVYVCGVYVCGVYVCGVYVCVVCMCVCVYMNVCMCMYEYKLMIIVPTVNSFNVSNIVCLYVIYVKYI